MPIFNRICTEFLTEISWRSNNVRKCTELQQNQPSQGFDCVNISGKKENCVGVFQLPPQRKPVRQTICALPDRTQKTQTYAIKNYTARLRAIPYSTRGKQSPPPRIIRVPDAAKNIKKFEKHVGLREGQQVKIQTSRPNREQFDGYLGWVAGFNPSTEVVHVAIDHLTVVFYADELLPFEFQEVGV